MKRNRLYIFLALMLVAIPFKNGIAQATSSAEDEKARLFVQDFYNWYEQIYNREAELIDKGHNAIGPLDVVSKLRKNDFTPVLSKALIAYYRGPQKSDEVDDLDSDPYLSAQDTAPDGYAYQTGNVKRVGNNLFVNVYCAKKGSSQKSLASTKPDIIAEVRQDNGKWKFVNFIYPLDHGQTSLLKIINK